MLGSRHDAARLAVRILQIVAAASGVAMFLAGSLDGGIRFLGVLVILSLLWRVQTVTWPAVGFAVMLIVAALAGAAHWYTAAWWVDDVIHLLLPAATGAMLFVLLAQYRWLHEPHTLPAAAVMFITLALTLAVAGLWELYEWFAVTVLSNTSINIGYDDTIFDIALAVAGAGGAGVALWHRSRSQVS